MYLLQSRANSIYTRAELELTDTSLRCGLAEHSRWVAKALGIDDLKDRLAAGEPITAFDFRREHLDVKWLRWFHGWGVLRQRRRFTAVARVAELSLHALVARRGGRRPRDSQTVARGVESSEVAASRVDGGTTRTRF